MAASTLQPNAALRDEDPRPLGPGRGPGLEEPPVPVRGPGAARGPAGVVDLGDWLRAGRRPDRPGVLPPAVQAPPAERRASGDGMRVALVGPALDLRHPDLAGARVTPWLGGRSVLPDERGTALATLLVGQGATHVRGLVPHAQLFVAPADPAAAGGDEAVARAVRWAVAAGVHVVVLPFGRQRPGRRLTATLHGALALGTRIMASAGEFGAESLAFPASVTGVVAVAAHDGEGLLPSSPRRADLSAPGLDVPAGGTAGPVLLSGAAVATVLAAGCHLAWRSVPAAPGA